MLNINRVTRLTFPVILFACAIYLLSGFSAFAQSYQLRQGDTVRVEVLSLSDAVWSSTISAEGFLRFPHLGKFQADGLTLDELSDAMILRMAGQTLQNVGASRDRIVVLDERSLFIEVERYRPVTVLGMVERQGPVEYTPDLRVRSLLGAAGGLRAGIDGNVQDNRAFILTARLNELRQTEAWLQLALWRIDAKLDPDLVDVVPETIASAVGKRMDAADIENVRIEVIEGLADLDREAANTDALIGLTEDRIEALQIAFAQYEVVTAAEESRLADSVALQERGLTVANNVSNVRTAALNASARLFSIEADIAETNRELRGLIERRERIYTQARLDLLDERSRTRRSLDETGALIAGLQSELAFTYSQLASTEEDADISIAITLHRTDGETMLTLTPSLNDPVQPGDVVDFQLVLSAQ